MQMCVWCDFSHEVDLANSEAVCGFHLILDILLKINVSQCLLSLLCLLVDQPL